MAENDKTRLGKYRQKRDFAKTAEPPGEPAGVRQTESSGGVKSTLSEPIFVIQKHDATRLHYDFRLEIDGVLASWAVPKGPSLDPKQKRLAVHVEDHPLDYATFEGTIPKDEYGGGTVMVWDSGTVKYKEGESAREMLERGNIEVELSGQRLRGGFVLIRTRMGGQNKNWLLIKRRDAFADSTTDVLEARPDSVKTGRSLEQIAGETPA